MNTEEKTKQYADLADEYLQQERYDEAIVLYRQLLDLNPDDESFLLALAWAYHDNRQLSQAISCFELLLESELKRKIFTGFAFDELVRIFKETGHQKRLVAMCERVNAAQPDDVGLLGDLADAYLKAGEADKAVEISRKMTEMEPDDAVFFCHLGRALIAAGKYDCAEEAYSKASEIEPSKASLFYSKMGNVYLETGQYERAEKAVRKCISISPDELLYQLDFGDILIRQGLLKEAEAAYKTAASLNPCAAGIYYNRLGNALAKAGHYHLAIDAFQKAITEDTKNPFYYIRLAESYLAAGLINKATEARKKAEALNEF
jgi:tetratricopeptide (TPR) repeat protein